MRYIAHTNGASLVFASVREKIPSQYYKTLLMAQVQEGSKDGTIQTNPN